MFIKKRVVPSIQIESFKGKIAVTDEENLKNLRLINFTEEVLQTLKQMEQLMVNHIPNAVQTFYDLIMENQGLVEIINTYSSRERLEQTLTHHISEWFQGIIDDEYIKKRMKISKMHVHIGLETRWYLAACHNLQNIFLVEILKKELPKEQTVMFVEALNKIMS